MTYNAHSIEDLTDRDSYILLQRIVARLAGRFAGVFAVETVERCVLETYTSLRRGAKVLHYLPLLAEHRATERLTALAQFRGAIGKALPEVLFACVHNAGRLQLAAALMARYAPGRFQLRSVRSISAVEVDPVVAEALAEAGIYLTGGGTLVDRKPLPHDIVCAADVVITMGCGEACPVYPGKRYLDWEDLADPVEQPIEVVRTIRDEIDQRVRDLLAEIAPTPPLPADPFTAMEGSPSCPGNPASCSSASTMPVARRWPPGG